MLHDGQKSPPTKNQGSGVILRRPGFCRASRQGNASLVLFVNPVILRYIEARRLAIAAKRCNFCIWLILEMLLDIENHFMYGLSKTSN